MISHGRTGLQCAEDVYLGQLFQRYWAQHACHLPRKGAGVQRRNLEVLTECVGDVLLADFKLVRQYDLVRELKEERGYSQGYIRRIFSAGFAAINWAYKNEEIDRAPPCIPLPDSPPKEYVAPIDALAAFWNCPKPFYLHMYFVLALSTGARPSAITPLTKFQCDMERGLINLSPPGHVETKKRRPVVPMCATARRWIEACPTGPLVTANGRTPVSEIFPVWREYKRKAGLSEEFTPASIRHTVASELRRRGVPKWDVEGLGGWRSAGGHTAERYAKYDPNYLRPAVEAIEALFADIAKAAKTSLYPKSAPVARQLPAELVGARGIEPRTSTMSR
ncbi:MAG: tyrosine-type recombinase/integrase [Parvularculaceae bacterium]